MRTKILSALIILLFLFASCDKEEFTPVRVTYTVKVADSSTVTIAYNSDYYYDSDNRKPVNYTSEGGIWAASHIAYEPEEYYIRVEYISSVSTETDFEVKVFFDDADAAVDSVVSNTIIPLVELKGNVTN